MGGDDFSVFLLAFLADAQECRRCRAKGCDACAGTGLKQSKKHFTKRCWTSEEDRALLRIIERHEHEWASRKKGINFVTVSKEFGGRRTTQSIRERYRNHLKKDVS